MLRISIALVITLVSFISIAQEGYWQQEVNYTIDVRLNDKSHELSGYETMQYINNSPDELDFIYIHLWPNAYNND